MSKGSWRRPGQGYADNWERIFGKTKHSVTIVGLGESWQEWTPADEVWGINQAALRVPCDLVWHMDDCRVQEARAKAGNGNVRSLLSMLKDTERFITSTVYPEYEGAEAFPLNDITAFFGRCYFNSTVSYAIAYAIYKGFKEIRLYGIDFTYPNSHKAEAGRGCVEYWLGRGEERGITVVLPESTTLMDQCVTVGKPYGYDAWTISGSEMTPKAIPTAEEIEARYG